MMIAETLRRDCGGSSAVGWLHKFDGEGAAGKSIVLVTAIFSATCFLC